MVSGGLGGAEHRVQVEEEGGVGQAGMGKPDNPLTGSLTRLAAVRAATRSLFGHPPNPRVRSP